MQHGDGLHPLADATHLQTPPDSPLSGWIIDGEQDRSKYAGRVALLILITTALRLGFGWALGLGVDESYMVAAGRTLSLGYFDHPPASWWLSWGAAHLLGSEAPIVVRLPFILLFALSSWLMFRLGTEVADARAGYYAALLLNLSPVFGVTTGTWVLPDGPLDCALLAATLALVRALPATGDRALLWWLACGLFAGLALFSKYSAILWIGGAFAYLLSSRAHRHWLAHPAPVVCSPARGADLRAGRSVEREARLGVVRVPGRPRHRPALSPVRPVRRPGG